MSLVVCGKYGAIEATFTMEGTTYPLSCIQHDHSNKLIMNQHYLHNAYISAIIFVEDQTHARIHLLPLNNVTNHRTGRQIAVVDDLQSKN